MSNSRLIDLVARRFGRLAVLSRSAEEGPAKWNCICDCGNTIVLNGKSLRSGNTRSCGCLHKDQLKARVTKHGKSHTPEYHAWHDMLQRCFKQDHKWYPDYGGRGIKVCDSWLVFENFLADMGLRPTKVHSLDRLDNDGDYAPPNCRWATRRQQYHNRRTLKPHGYKGVCKKRNRFFAMIRINYRSIRLGTFTTPIEAARAYDQAALKYLGADARINGV